MLRYVAGLIAVGLLAVGVPARAQTLLAAPGYEPGPADGKWGGQTAAAHRAFLQAAGLPAADALTPETLRALRKAAENRGEADASQGAGRLDAAAVASRRGDVAGLRAARAAGADMENEVRRAREMVESGDRILRAWREDFPWKKGVLVRDCDGCPEMVLIPSRSFTMGSPSSEEGRYKNEGPQRRVTIGSAFAIGRYEVTRGEYERFASETGHSSGDSCWVHSGSWKERSGLDWKNPGFGQSDEHPVTCVSWSDAKAYVRWLSRKTGKEYRLLSEAEWEYVARAGTQTARYWGESAEDQCRHGNGADSASGDFGSGKAQCDDGYSRTAPAGSFVENAFGLHDMLGNVWEWVEDCWNDSYAGAPAGRRAWESGNCSRRVLRGGSWFSIPNFLRSASRLGFETGNRSYNFGFRVARTLAP